MMRGSEIRTYLAELDADVLTADGFDDALIGYVQQFNLTVALYDRQKCIEILMKRDGMDEDDANEFFEFNVQGAYVGDTTPAFATILAGASNDGYVGTCSACNFESEHGTEEVPHPVHPSVHTCKTHQNPR